MPPNLTPTAISTLEVLRRVFKVSICETQYLDIFGGEMVGAMADLARLDSVAVLTETLERTAEETEADEIILVPGDTDPACADAIARAVDGADLG